MNGIANPKVAFKVYTLRNLHDSNFQAVQLIHAFFLFFGSTTTNSRPDLRAPVQVQFIGRGRSFTCTLLGFELKTLFFLEIPGSQNGLYQWPITLGDVVHPFDIVKQLGTRGWPLTHAENYGNRSLPIESQLGERAGMWEILGQPVLGVCGKF
jgi:hypothetical protein